MTTEPANTHRRADPDYHGATLDEYQSSRERSLEGLRILERAHDDLRRRNRIDRLRRVVNRLQGRRDDEAQPAHASFPSAMPPALDRLTRLHQSSHDSSIPPNASDAHSLRESRDARTAAYSDRVPNRNSLYDWSPANEADDEAELESILAELRREQPNTHPDLLRVLGRSQLDSERDRSRTASSRLLNSSQPSQSADSSLRSAAILQSVRRQPRFAARNRDYANRFHADREAGNRSPHPTDLRDRGDRYTYADSPRTLRLSMDRRQQPTRENDAATRSDPFRRFHQDRNSTTSSSASPMLEQTIKYLSHIRHTNSVDESMDFAIDAGFLSKGYFDEYQENDWITDSSTIPPPAETSWLTPGAVLSGCQHATTVTSTVTTAGAGTTTTLYRIRNVDSANPYTSNSLSGLYDPSSRYLHSYHGSSSPRNQSANPDAELVTSHSPQQDRWPVKVTIHSVDYEQMSLSATMEAYNVPSHPHSHQSLLNASTDGTSFAPTPTRTSSITTFLEGEILDFSKHTLLTESFKSSAANDATYWRKLPPFQDLTDDEIIRRLLSKCWFEDVFSKEWILMRWKERCFVKSLNRSTADPIPPPSTTTTPRPMNPVDMDIAVANAAVDAAVASFYSSTSAAEPAEGTSSPLQIWSSASAAGGDTEHSSFDDSGCGLTISGFYYVCLRRSDGRLDGLYFDPQSSPYQCLKLESVRGGVVPAWGFR